MAVDSSLQLAAHPIWYPQGERENHSLEVSAAGVPRPHWCPQLSSAPVSAASAQEQGWLSLCGPQHVSRAPIRLRQRACRARPARGGARRAGSPDSHPAPGSTPSTSLSPSLFLLPTPSVFEVRVKKANVPDLSAITSCSGSLLGINKINLTKNKRKNKTKNEREREEKKAPNL